MPHEKLIPQFSFTQDRLQELEQVVPEAFADGRVNWETLRESLGDFLEDGEGQSESFGLSWPGKRDARRLAAKPSHGALLPAPGEGVNEGTTKNLFLEGDNLEVLKLLQKSYAGRVKMIYIDPPYNTGSDLIYEDDFTEPTETYLEKSGLIGEGGELLSSNPKSSGRFHTKWLNMIYPRLRLARTLLRDDGVIFVSIDDNEVHNLRAVMNEIFGEENVYATLIIRANSRGQTYKQIAKTHEYILVATKSTDTELLELEKQADQNDLDFNDDIGAFSVREIRNRNPRFGRHNRPNLFYPIYVNPSQQDADGFYPISLEKNEQFSIEVLPFNSTGRESCWRWGKVLLEKNTNSNTLKSNAVGKKKTDGTFGIYEKYRKTTFKPKSIWDDNSFLTETGTVQLRELGLAEVFSFPKPVELIKRCVQIGSQEDDIVLDFFAGSGTTAQAVLELNHDEGGNRQFICSQVPDATGRDDFSTIAEISKERIRRVIKKLGQQPVLSTRDTSEDLGFKVFKLGPSNLKVWRENEDVTPEQLSLLFDGQETPLCEGWTDESLRAEVLLLEGFPLDSKVEKQPLFTKNAVYLVTSPACGHRLWTCFDSKLDDRTLDNLAFETEDVFVCLDSALDDNAKLRLASLCTLKTI